MERVGKIHLIKSFCAWPQSLSLWIMGNVGVFLNEEKFGEIYFGRFFWQLHRSCIGQKKVYRQEDQGDSCLRTHCNKNVTEQVGLLDAPTGTGNRKRVPRPILG